MTQRLFPGRKKQLELTQMTHKIYVYHHSVSHLIVAHFSKNTFDRIVYADIDLNPKSLNWPILKMDNTFDITVGFIILNVWHKHIQYFEPHTEKKP